MTLAADDASVFISNFSLPKEDEIPTSPRVGWRRKADCLSSNPRMFFPDLNSHTDLPDDTEVAQAKLVCYLCPVKMDCLSHALANEATTWQESGIFGGLTPPERARLRAQLVNWKPDATDAVEVVEPSPASELDGLEWLLERFLDEQVEWH